MLRPGPHVVSQGSSLAKGCSSPKPFPWIFEVFFDASVARVCRFWRPTGHFLISAEIQELRPCPRGTDATSYALRKLECSAWSALDAKSANFQLNAGQDQRRNPARSLHRLMRQVLANWSVVPAWNDRFWAPFGCF